MTRHSARRTALLAALGTVALVAAVTGVQAAATSPAEAHNRLIASTPSDGSTIEKLPSAFSITTDLPMLALDGDDGFALRLRDAGGRYYGDGCVKIVDATMSSGAVRLGAAGHYTMDWQIVSADGHPVSGELAFDWAPPAGYRAATGRTAVPACGSSTREGSGGGTGGGTSGTNGEPVDRSQGRAPDVAIGDVLWIGGGVVIVLGAAAAVLLVLTRRRPERRGD